MCVSSCRLIVLQSIPESIKCVIDLDLELQETDAPAVTNLKTAASSTTIRRAPPYVTVPLQEAQKVAGLQKEIELLQQQIDDLKQAQITGQQALKDAHTEPKSVMQHTGEPPGLPPF